MYQVCPFERRQTHPRVVSHVVVALAAGIHVHQNPVIAIHQVPGGHGDGLLRRAQNGDHGWLGFLSKAMACSVSGGLGNG